MPTPIFKKRGKKPTTSASRLSELDADPRSTSTSSDAAPSAAPDTEAKDRRTGPEEDPEDDDSKPETNVSDIIAFRQLKRSAGTSGAGIDLDRLNEGESTRHSKSKNSSSTNPPKSKESLWDEQLQRGGIVSQDLLGKAEENEPERKRRRVQDNFQTETGTVDVDKYMLAYIEEELAKRRPTPSNPADQPRRTTEEQVKQAILDPNDELSQIAAQYRALQQRNRPPKKEEDDEGSVGLSAQMLASVPEVDLGIEAKLRNIEQTGIARRKLLAQKQQPTAKEELEANTRFANRSGVATESEFRAQIAENPNEIEDNFRFNTSFAKLADRQDKRATASDAYVADKFRQRQREHRKK